MNPSTKCKCSSEVIATDDHIYYNITIFNDDTVSIPAEFNETRRSVLLENPNDYYLSIVKFSVPGTGIPIFSFKFQDGVTPLTSVYSVTLEYAGVAVQKYVVYLPVIPPTPPQNSGYSPYTVYSYQKFLDMINIAFQAALTQLQGAPANYPGTFAPFMRYNESTFTVDLLIPTEMVTNGVDVWMNQPLYSFFNCYNIDTFAYNQPNGEDIKFVNQNLHGTNLYTDTSVVGPPAATYYINAGEFDCLPLWNDFQKIVLTSSDLPIRSTSISNLNQDGVNKFQPIVTDLDPSIVLGPDFRTDIQYAPSAEYRLIDMLATTQLDKVNLNFLWESKDQILLPIYIPPQRTATATLMFRRKGVPFQKAVKRDDLNKMGNF